MKTPDEIKQGLLCCSHSDMSCSQCPYDGICNTASGETPEDDAVGLIDQLLSSYSQVSKALCGKENATLDELLQAVSQLKSRIAQVERERDAAVHDLPIGIDCNTCKYSERAYEEQPCSGCKEYRGPWYPVHWEWRGVCTENAKEESTC